MCDMCSQGDRGTYHRWSGHGCYKEAAWHHGNIVRILSGGLEPNYMLATLAITPICPLSTVEAFERPRQIDQSQVHSVWLARIFQTPVRAQRTVTHRS